jgi:tetratricopeptide (TPR) repeat protein
MSPAPHAAASRRISVAIVALEADDTLAATLATARKTGDETIVVDCSPGGKAGDIARAHGATVVKRAWDRDFSAVRNAALDRATGDWILWLEPGETMSATSANELRQFAQRDANPNNVYMLVITVPRELRNITGEQAARVRLLPNARGLRYQGRLREQLEPAPEALGLSTAGVHWRIERGLRENDPQFKMARARRNLELIDLDLAERGPRACLLVARGEALSGLGDQRAAVAAFRQAIALAPPTSTVLREAYYGLINSHVYAADRPAQISACVEALEKFPLDAQLLCAMGGYMQAAGQLDLSAQAYRTAVDFGQLDPETWHVPDTHEIAAVCLSLTYQVRGDDEEGRRVLEHMLARRPEAHRVRRQLIDLDVRYDRRKEALAEFDRLPLDTPHREALRGSIRGACLAAKRNWTPALGYLQPAYAAGCRDVLCLRWLSVALLATEQPEAARPVLAEWLAIEPRGGEAQKYIEAIGLPPAIAVQAAPVIQSLPAAGLIPESSATQSDPRRFRVDGPKPLAAGALAVPRLVTGPPAAAKPQRRS